MPRWLFDSREARNPVLGFGHDRWWFGDDANSNPSRWYETEAAIVLAVSEAKFHDLHWRQTAIGGLTALFSLDSLLSFRARYKSDLDYMKTIATR